jgi:hypothetical protein
MQNESKKYQIVRDSFHQRLPNNLCFASRCPANRAALSAPALANRFGCCKGKTNKKCHGSGNDLIDNNSTSLALHVHGGESADAEADVPDGFPAEALF